MGINKWIAVASQVKNVSDNNQDILNNDSLSEPPIEIGRKGEAGSVRGCNPLRYIPSPSFLKGEGKSLP